MPSNLVFNSELGDFVPRADLPKKEDADYAFEEDASIFVEGQDTGPNVPGGTGVEVLQPPQTFYVNPAFTKVRSNPDGSSSVDIVIEIDDGTQAQYDVRVTKN